MTMPTVDIDTDDEPIDGYLARPDTDEPAPGVVVIHEIFGLNDDIRSWCDRFADAGYVALAPDLYDRGWTVSCVVSVFRDMRRGEGEAFDDIEAARRHLVDDEACNGDAGIIGFCMGGGFALLMAPTDLFDVASVNYGEVPDDADDLLEGACPVVASYGERDGTLGDDATRLREALEVNDIPHDFKLYPDAGHGFLNDKESRTLELVGSVFGIGYHEESARDAWSRIREMFDRHLRREETAER